LANVGEIPEEFLEDTLTEEQLEELNRFKTYLNYLKAISLFFTKDPEASRLSDVVNSRAFSSLRGGQCPDTPRVRQLMRNAWCTEIQLSVAARQVDFLGYSNHWAPVQLYYSVYLALRALFLASNQDVPNDHSATLKCVAEMIRTRPDLFPQPWRTLCVGKPKGSTLKYPNLPPAIVVQNISPLTNPGFAPFWDYYCLLLRTTRDRQGIIAVDEWKKRNKKKNIPKAKRTETMDNMPPTSFFYALYRLRLRSNYADAESFLITLENEVDNKDFHRSLRSIGWYTLKIIELLVARHIGKSQFGIWVDEFSKLDRSGLGAELVRRRWSTLQRLW